MLGQGSVGRLEQEALSGLSALGLHPCCQDPTSQRLVQRQAEDTALPANQPNSQVLPPQGLDVRIDAADLGALALLQLPLHLLAVGVLHGFNGWKQGREVEGRLGRGQEQRVLLPLELRMETGAESGKQRVLGWAVSWTEWLWVSCSTSLSLSTTGR